MGIGSGVKVGAGVLVGVGSGVKVGGGVLVGIGSGANSSPHAARVRTIRAEIQYLNGPCFSTYLPVLGLDVVTQCL